MSKKTPRSNHSNLLSDKDWIHTSAKTFWGEIASGEHVLQIYKEDDAFMNVLSGFVADGINSGDCMILIATSDHLTKLEAKLSRMEVQVPILKAYDRYIAFDAEECLSRFMVNDWPDENLFMHELSLIFQRVKRKGRNVRAFGEMVAILSSKGMMGATIQLEKLWNQFMRKFDLTLFCAYPENIFTDEKMDSVLDICCTHAKVINGKQAEINSLSYQDHNSYKESHLIN